MKKDKKPYVQPTVCVVAYGHFCDSEFGDWGSGVEDGAGKETDFDDDDDFPFDEEGNSFYNLSRTKWE